MLSNNQPTSTKLRKSLVRKTQSSSTFSTALMFTALACCLIPVGRRQIFSDSQDITSFQSDYQCTGSPDLSEAVIPLGDARVINKTLIERIVDRGKNCGQIVDMIDYMRHQHPVLKNTFDLAFNHLDGLTIRVFPKEEFVSEWSANFAASFDSVTKTMVFRKDILNIEDLRHETRHTAWNTAQRILSQLDTGSSECYFPITPKEKEKVKSMINAGKNRVEHLDELLRKEELAEISNHDQKKLNDLRLKYQNDYNQDYKCERTVSMSRQDYYKLEQDNDKQFIPGDTIFGAKLGKIRLKQINLVEDRIILQFDYLDPLYALVYTALDNLQNVETYYEEDRIRETDAYHHGNIPQGLIEYLYPEFYAYTNGLLEKSREIALQQKLFSKLSGFGPKDLKKLKMDAILQTLRNPNNFKVKNAKNMVEWIKLRGSFISTADAITGAKTLIAKGFYKGEANLELARMEYETGNHQDSAACYKRAIKTGMSLSTRDRINYAIVLTKIGHLKDAEEQIKIAKKLEPSIYIPKGLGYSSIPTIEPLRNRL